MALLRLDKIIADSGKASRKEAKALIRTGRVTVDGRPAASPEEKADPESSEVCLDGQRLGGGFRYFMMYKPAGVLSATEDREGETVLDLLTPELRRLGLFPVGRLDKDTTGLLLLTNDGDLAHRVISPKKHVSKVYRAELDAALEPSDVEAFREGIVLGDGTRCLPAELTYDSACPRTGIVTVYEGKYHQVKRMFASRGKNVVKLHRERIGKLCLDPRMKPGEALEIKGSRLLELLFDEAL